MKPKHSTGYFTPQASKSKTINRRNSEETNDLNMAKDINDSLFEKLMNCPIKRQLVLKIISSEKDKIEEYKRQQTKEQGRKIVNASPLSKVHKRFQCESPTALLRRRALEQQSRQSPISDTHSDDNGSNSCSGLSVASNSSPVPFDKLLDGVIAYAEIKSRDQDRSNGAKALMRSMGATVRDQFTKDVTHVVFKDGSFTTYQKAKLMKVHLVSVLWIEAVRSTKTKISEKKFPALGTDAYDHNVSTLCSQMQKDYEEIIRDELRRSLATGTPLPSTKSLIDRRRTIMTPMTSSFKLFSQEFPSSQDQEVENILHPRSQSQMFEEEPVESRLSPELTSDDDSDLGPIIDGSIVKRKKNQGIKENQIVINSVDNLGDYIEPNVGCVSAGKSKILHNNALPSRTPQKTKLCDSSMDLTLLDRDLIIDDSISIGMKENEIPNISDNSIYNKKTPKLIHRNISQINKTPRRTGDNLFNIPDDNLYKRRTRQLKSTVNVSSDNSVNISKDCILPNKSNSTSNMSSLKLSHQSDIQIISKNTCTSPTVAQDENIKKFDNVDKSSSTNMSSLHISSTSSNKENNVATICDKEINGNIETSTSTNMSALLISSDSSNNKSVEKKLESKTAQEQSFNSTTDKSFSPLNTNLMKAVMQVLDDSPLPDANVTKRRGRQSIHLRSPYNTRRKTLSVDDKSTDSDRECKDDSNESISPSKTRREKSNSRKDIPQTEKKTHCNVDKDKSKRRNHKQMNKTPTDDESTVSDGSEKKNKMRKLYNPDDALKGVDFDSDEKERESKRHKAKKRKSDEGVFLNPNIINVTPNILITAKAKEFLDKNKIDINALLNKESEGSEEEKTSSKRKKKNINKKRNSDADEQKELADEFSNIQKTSGTNKKVDKTAEESGGGIVERRQSARLSKFPRKKLNLNSSTSSNDEKNPVMNRRSTMEFQTVSQLSAKKKLKIDKNKRPSIVCTKLHKEDIQVFNQIVKKLGGFVIEDEVSSKTTHLVAGEPKRTINMLRAIARGCWVLKYEWLLKSLEEGKWLPEEDYEEVDFSPSVQQCRLQRQAFGPSFSLDIFQNCGPIYIAKGSTPRCSDLRELVSLCKGNVVTIPRNASIVVGEYTRYEGIKCVKEAWLLDSITFNKKMPFKKYIITTDVNSPTV